MKFEFSGLLLKYVDYQNEAVVQADTLGRALDELITRHPKLAEVLYDGSGRVRRTHRVFRNGERVDPNDRDLPLREGDEVTFVTSIAGG
jgi:sulfur-carrier protein